MAIELIRAGAPERVRSPWTEVQVESLNAYQLSGVWHEFTCGDEGCRHVLVAIPAGWICPVCPYTQDWAWAFMADESWRKALGVTDGN